MNPQLVLHLSVFLVAFAPLFAQLVSLLPLEIIWWRCLIATLVLVPFTWKNIKKIWESKKGLFLGISGILLGLHWWIYFLSIQYTSVAVGALVLFTYPLFTAILEPFLVKSKHSLHQVVSGFGIIAGVFFLLPEFSLENTFTQGILWGLVSALAFSFRNIITKKHLSSLPTLPNLHIQIAIALLVLSVPLILTKNIEFPTKENMYMLLLLAVVFTVGAHGLIVKSFQYFSATTISIVGSLQVLYATILSFIILHEVPNINFY
jgi:drug/metabolite transporter (DMT)-like permease